MTTANRLIGALCGALAAAVLIPPLPAAAQTDPATDPATGLAGAAALPEASGDREAASAEATGIGLGKAVLDESTILPEATPGPDVQPSGVLVGSLSEPDRPQAPSFAATGVGR